MIVQSSNIAEVEYDDVEERLYVTFNSGARWYYFPVPYEVYIEMLEAPSVGRFFASRIKGVYDGRKA